MVPLMLDEKFKKKLGPTRIGHKESFDFSIKDVVKMTTLVFSSKISGVSISSNINSTLQYIETDLFYWSTGLKILLVI
jgi:hypothetical protein